jgi:hypothetical protein
VEENLIRIPPDNLPTISDAKLPIAYERAKEAIAECDRVDECKDWINKSEALASYALQARDNTLYESAVRIKARAIERAGNLLKEHHAQGKRSDLQLGGIGPTKSRREEAEAAGLSKDQQIKAMRLTNIPRKEFEALVEASPPASIKELAALGKKSNPKPLTDMKGRDPEEFQMSTYAVGEVMHMAKAIGKRNPEAVVRGATQGKSLLPLRENVRACIQWLTQIDEALTRRITQ